MIHWYKYFPYKVRKGFSLLDPRPHGRGWMFELRMFLQRGFKGYNTRDTWSLDYHLDNVIIGMITELRSRDFGNPIYILDEDGKEYNRRDADDFEYDWSGENGEDADYPALWVAVMTAVIDGFEAHKRLEEGYVVDGVFHLPYHDSPEGKALTEEFELAKGLFMHNYTAFWD